MPTSKRRYDYSLCIEITRYGLVKLYFYNGSICILVYMWCVICFHNFKFYNFFQTWELIVCSNKICNENCLHPARLQIFLTVLIFRQSCVPSASSVKCQIWWRCSFQPPAPYWMRRTMESCWQPCVWSRKCARKAPIHCIISERYGSCNAIHGTVFVVFCSSNCKSWYLF